MEKKPLDFQFDDSLKKALGFALESHRGSDDRVDINTEGFFFGLSQVEPTRTYLRLATKDENFRRVFDARKASLSGVPTPLGPEALREHKLSDSVDRILALAREQAGNNVLGVTPVLTQAVAIHPEILEGYEINPERVLKAIEEGLGGLAARAFADKETAEDHLNRAVYARAMGGLIGVPATATPLTVGIYGPWGQGKSSLMLRIEQELKALKQAAEGILPYLTVHFNAWAFDEQDKVWAGLVSEIHRAYEKEVPWKTRAWHHLARRKWEGIAFAIGVLLALGAIGVLLSLALGRFTGSEWQAAVGSLLGLTGFPLAWKFGEAVLFPVGRQLERYLRQPSYREKLGFQQEVLDDFKGMLDILLGGLVQGRERERRLIVFIDDLDRCRPESVVEVLEALRIFFNENGVIVILGLDEEFVSLAVADRYAHIVGKDESPQTRLEFGRSYLEKMVQLPVYIQEPGFDDLLPFALEMVQSAQDREVPEGHRLDRAETKDEPRPAGPIPEPPLPTEKTALKALDFDEEVARVMEELREFLPANPRQLKRLLNIYRLIHYLIKRAGLLFDGRAALAWLLLRQQSDRLVDAIDRALRFEKEPSEKTLRDLLGMPVEEAVRRYSRDRHRLPLLQALSDVPVAGLANIARYAAWFCVPYDLKEYSSPA